MATPLTAEQLVRQLRRYGVSVVETSGWRTHNRNHKGAWGPVHGVMLHHTASRGSSGTLHVVRDGRIDLPGPLAHGLITKDGTVHLTGWGRANHAGMGDARVWTSVVSERYGSNPPRPRKDSVDGNTHFYGFECENAGDGKDPWPAEQLAAIERVSAAICDAHGWSEKSVIGHLEWTRSKVDPKGFRMRDMRNRIHDRIGNPSGLVGSSGRQSALWNEVLELKKRVEALEKGDSP